MTTILIQARLDSTRLPGKVLMPLGNSTVIGQVIHRARKSGDVIIVSQDQSVIDVAIAEGVGYSKFITDRRDVLAEYYQAAEWYNADPIIRLTGDCPCVSPTEIDKMIRFFQEEPCDIICNHSDAIGGFGIDGLDIEVFSFEALEKAYLSATSDFDREHVCPWLYDNLKVQQVASLWDMDEKLSIDTQQDYDLVFEIFEKLGSDFETRDLVEFFKEKEK